MPDYRLEDRVRQARTAARFYEISKALRPRLVKIHGVEMADKIIEGMRAVSEFADASLMLAKAGLE